MEYKGAVCQMAKVLEIKRRHTKLENESKLNFDRKEAYEIGVLFWIAVFSFIVGWITALRRIKI